MPKWSKKPKDTILVGRGTLRKLATGGIWHFHHKNEYGEWTTRSTSHRDRAGAVKWAEAYSLSLTREEFGLGNTKKLSGDDDINKAIDEWLAYQHTQNKRKTHRSYTSIMRKLRKFLTTKPGLRRLRNITVETILEYREWALGIGNHKNTIDNSLTAIRSFFNWCISMGKMRENPAAQQRHGVRVFFNEAKPRIQTYTSDEYRRIVEAADADLHPVVVLLANTGMRISELAMLAWDDVDFDDKWIHIRSKITPEGRLDRPKDDTDRRVPINPDAEAVLRQLGATENQDGFVLPLPNPKNRDDYTERTYLERLKLVSTATGIPPKKLTLHNFRRFFVCECADRGVPMATVIEWLGHDDMQMVMHYYSLRDQSSQVAMKRFSEAGRSGLLHDSRQRRPVGGKDAVESSRADAGARRRTTPDSLEHLGNEKRNPRSEPRNADSEGKTERAGFEPAIRV